MQEPKLEQTKKPIWLTPEKQLKINAVWKATHKKEIKEYYQKNKEHFQEYQREYWRTHREQYQRVARKYRERHPEQVIAKRLASQLPTDSQCKICGSTENLHRHHPDYSKPLEIITLCRDCHLGKVWTSDFSLLDVPPQQQQKQEQ